MQRTIKTRLAARDHRCGALLPHQPRHQATPLLGSPLAAANVPHEQRGRHDGHTDTAADDDVTDQSLHVLPDEMGRDTSPALSSKKANPRGLAQVLDVYGAGERNRTLDLRITSALLYQLSYTG